ncbi:MAG: family 16 glycoside hydrolase [Chloroflexota bacterium]
MYRMILFATIISLFLSGCNIPTGAPAEPTPDVVATQVAAILTSQPTPQPEATATQLINTPQPTPAPLQATNTPEPTATATTPTGDPRQTLGDPTFVDTLDSARSFGLQDKHYDDDFTFIRVEDGALVLTSRYATGYRGWRTGGTELQNAYIETLVRTGECSGLDTYGLVFRSPDFVKGYWFQITCDGSWFFGYWDGSQYINLVDGSNVSDAIRTGSNQVNRLGVMAVGDTYTLYVNGVKIGEIQDSTFTDPGTYGIVIAARNTPNFTVYAEVFSYWVLN